MRLIAILIALAVLGLLVARQLQPAGTQPAAALATQPSGVPVVPQRPEQVPAFNRQMNDFVDQHNADQKQRIDDATQ